MSQLQYTLIAFAHHIGAKKYAISSTTTPEQALIVLYGCFESALNYMLPLVGPRQSMSISCPDEYPPTMPKVDAYLSAHRNKDPHTGWGAWLQNMRCYLSSGELKPDQAAWLVAVQHFARLFHTLETDQREFCLLGVSLETRLLQWLNKESPTNLFMAFDELLRAAELHFKAYNEGLTKSDAYFKERGSEDLCGIYQPYNILEELKLVRANAQCSFAKSLTEATLKAV